MAHPSRLQLIYEILPVAFLVEKAGGKTTDGVRSVLDIAVKGYKQRSSFVAGSRNDVDKMISKIKDEEEYQHKKMREIAEAANEVWSYLRHFFYSNILYVHSKLLLYLSFLTSN